MARRKRIIVTPAKGPANFVKAAVEIVGGPSAVAELCGVARQSVHVWINEGRVERLIDGLRLSRASGIPIERLAGEDPSVPPSVNRRPYRRRSQNEQNPRVGKREEGS